MPGRILDHAQPGFSFYSVTHIWVPQSPDHVLIFWNRVLVTMLCQQSEHHMCPFLPRAKIWGEHHHSLLNLCSQAETHLSRGNPFSQTAATAGCRFAYLNYGCPACSVKASRVQAHDFICWAPQSLSLHTQEVHSTTNHSSPPPHTHLSIASSTNTAGRNAYSAPPRDFCFRCTQ